MKRAKTQQSAYKTRHRDEGFLEIVTSNHREVFVRSSSGKLDLSHEYTSILTLYYCL